MSIRYYYSIEHKMLGVAPLLLVNQGVLLAAENTGATTLPLRASINFPVAGSAFRRNGMRSQVTDNIFDNTMISLT